MNWPNVASSLKRASALLILIQICAISGIRAEDGELKTGTFKFADIDVHYKSMEPAEKKDRPVVLFLHGAKFTSDNWVHIGSLAKVRDMGYKAIAVDLPGHGQTNGLPYSDNNMRAEFVLEAFKFALGGADLTSTGGVLVSPSMSGTYAIPFLDRYGRQLKGWVALAPVGVRKWGGPWEDTHKSVDLLAMYGEKDPLLPDADVLLKLFEKSRKLVVPGADHPCYLQKPDVFNSELDVFLKHSFRPEKFILPAKRHEDEI